MATTLKLVLKENFAIQKLIEPFFSSLHLHYTLDGNHFVSFADDKVRIVCKDSGEVKQILPPPALQTAANEDDEIINFTISQAGDEDHIAIAFKSGLIRLYLWTTTKVAEHTTTDDTTAQKLPVSSVQLIKSWRSTHVGPIVRMCFDCTHSSLLATGGSDGNVIIWDLVGQYITHFLKGCKGVISLIAFESKPTSEQYYLAVSGTHDNKVHLWNLRTSELATSFEGHCSEVTDARFFMQQPHFSSKKSDKGGKEQMLITVSRDKIAIIWSLANLAAVRKIPIYDSISSMILLPTGFQLEFLKNVQVNGRVLGVAGEKGEISLWDSGSGRCFGKISVCKRPDSIKSDAQTTSGENNQLITQLMLNKTGELTIVTFENNIMLFDLEKLKLKKQYAGYNDEILDIKLLGDTEEHIAVATNSPNLKVFNMSSVSCLIVKAHDEIIINLQTFAANRNLLATCSKDKTFKIWLFDPIEFKLSCLFAGIGHEATVTALGAPFLCTKWLVSGSEDNTLKVWSLPFTESTGTSDIVVKKLVSQVTIKAHEKLVNCISVSPNDRLLVTCSNDKTAKIWKIDSKSFVASHLGTLFGHRRAVWSAVFSPLDQVVASSSADSTIKIWSLADFSCLKTFQGHEDSVLKVAFMSRGLQLLSSAADGNVKIWNIKDTECVRTIDAHESKIYSFLLSSDERTMITGSYNSEIKIWSDVTLKELEQKQKESTRQKETQELLQSLMAKRKWKQAIKFSLALNQPFTTLNILKEIDLELSQLHHSPADTSGSSSSFSSSCSKSQAHQQAFKQIMEKLSEKQLTTILNYAVLWNTNYRHCQITQIVVNAIIQILGIKFTQLPNIKEIVQKLDPYIRKHYARYDKLCQTVTFFDFLYNNMKMDVIEA